MGFMCSSVNSAFTNDLKRKENFSKNVHSCRLSLFNAGRKYCRMLS